jgi:CRP-like cAMP-binding protein
MKVEPVKGGSHLIAKLSKSVREQLEPHFKTVDLPQGKVLYEARSQVEQAYFPTTATLSAVAMMRDGSMIEVATVGREGGVGLPISSIPPVSANRVFTQIPGEAIQISAAILAKQVQKHLSVKQLFDSYQAAFLFQVSQSVACNGLHQVLQRCCRWLLATHDRVDGDEISLTQEFLSIMLGVRRATVTDVIQTLENQGLLGSSRGKIVVRDRAALEAAACECYSDVRAEYQRLLD